MIDDLVRQWFFQGDNKIYFTSNNTEVHYGMHLFVNWKRQNHEKVLKQYLEKEECKAEIVNRLFF